MKNKNSELKYSILLMAIPLAVVFGLYTHSRINSAGNDTPKISLNTNVPREIANSIEVIKNPYRNISITAKSAIVKDLNTGEIIYSKNPDAAMPLASINKVMTALVATIESNPDQDIFISQAALMTEGEDFLRFGERFSLKDLMEFMLVKSSNDGAAAIAQAVEFNSPGVSFVARMNQIANKIGMNNTYFLNVTGLDQNLTTAGSFGTSRDVAKMMEFTIKNYPEILSPTKEIHVTTESKNGISHNATNTNEIISELGNMIASKTGFTDLAGGNLAVIVDPSLNKPVIIVVLGSTFDGRFDDVLKLSNSLEEYFNYTIKK
jgi:D-alanyl-D-alanine carboxypeptidase